MNIKLPLKVCVIGAGQVGSTFAYALMIRGLASEIVLVDINRSLAEGQAEDISHGLAYTRPAKITAGDYVDCRDADIIVITAGAAQKPGETRLDLMKKNVDIFRDMIPKITEQNKNAILIVISNPVDILTCAAVKFSELPSHRVIGSGTTLDSARFRYLLSRHCQVDARNVHAYIVGEHGDSEVALWSLAQIAGMKVDQYCEQCRKECETIPKEFGIDKIPAIVVMAEKDVGIRFYGIPSGYEFASLIESIDYVASKPDLSRRVQEELKKIERDLHIQVFVTPMCPYCPEAVKTSHALAAASERVRADMVEISEFPHLANKYGIMGVPKVVVNEKFSFEGSLPELQFWDKIKKAL